MACRPVGLEHIPLPGVSLHTPGIMASRSQGLTFLEPHDHRRNTSFLALILKIPEKTSIGQLEVTCQHLNQSLWSLGKIQLNRPAKFGPTLLLKSVTGRTEVRAIVTGERPISMSLHNHVPSTYGQESFVLCTKEECKKQKQRGSRISGSRSKKKVEPRSCLAPCMDTPLRHSPALEDGPLPRMFWSLPSSWLSPPPSLEGLRGNAALSWACEPCWMRMNGALSGVLYLSTLLCSQALRACRCCLLSRL